MPSHCSLEDYTTWVILEDNKMIPSAENRKLNKEKMFSKFRKTQSPKKKE